MPGNIRAYARNHLRRLQKNEQGSMLLFVGIGLFTLVAATGVAVDMSRLQSVRAKLSSSLDAAGLAAGAKAHSADADTVVNNYLNVNYPEGYLDSRITDVDVQVNSDNTIITLCYGRGGYDLHADFRQ